MSFNADHKILFCFAEPYIFAFIFAAILLPFYIKWLKRLQVGQFIREEGPASHAGKGKTPTTGGAVFVVTTILSLFLFFILSSSWNILAIAAAILAFLCALLGASDDLAKVMKKNNQGLTPRLRLIIEIVLGLIFSIFILEVIPGTEILITAHSGFVLPPVIFLCLSVFLMTASTNAVNLHDGMDGLAAGTTMLVFLTLAIMLLHLGSYGLALLASCCAGSLGGFLIFNRYPAKIFMGDTGSLFLGGLLAGIVLASGLVLWFIPLALIYIFETLSVIAQVAYFKVTKPIPGSVLFKLTHKLPGEGKRLLRMAPLHHHFEAIFAEKGVAEWQVVLGFWFVQLLLCSLVLAVFFALR